MSDANARRRTTLPAAGALSVAAVAMVLTACGGGSGYGASGTTTPTTSASSGGDQETIGTASGSMGTYLTADEGRAVYLWEGDHGMASSCSSACASVWPPVTTEGAPKAEGNVVAADLGTIKRSDGKTQVTYKGHPLYYFAQDTAKGQTNGEGSNGFGAKWYLVKPSGTALDNDQSSSSSPSSAPGYGGY